MPYLGELIFCESFCKLQRLFAITQRHFRRASWVKRRISEFPWNAFATLLTASSIVGG